MYMPYPCHIVSSLCFLSFPSCAVLSDGDFCRSHSLLILISSHLIASRLISLMLSISPPSRTLSRLISSHRIPSLMPNYTFNFFLYHACRPGKATSAARAYHSLVLMTSLHSMTTPCQLHAMYMSCRVVSLPLPSRLHVYVVPPYFLFSSVGVFALLSLFSISYSYLCCNIASFAVMRRCCEHAACSIAYGHDDMYDGCMHVRCMRGCCVVEVCSCKALFGF